MILCIFISPDKTASALLALAHPVIYWSKLPGIRALAALMQAG